MAKLVTGGTGFIGSHLARGLLAQGEDVVLFDIAPRYRAVGDIQDRVKVLQGDLACCPEVLDAVKSYRVDCIFHTGALLSASAEENPLAAYMTNANGTLHVLEAARLFEVEQVIFVSSIATYGPGVAECVNEDVIQRPTTMYGVTKVFCERLGEYYNLKFGLDFRGVRLPSVIGPGRGPGGASAYSSLIVQEPALGRPYRVFVDEEATIPLLYIKDATNCLLSLHQAPKESLRRRIYNIEGFSPTAGQLASAVRGFIPEARIEFAPDPAMVDIVRSWPNRCDGARALEEWGWKSRYGLDEAVEDFISELCAGAERYE